MQSDITNLDANFEMVLMKQYFDEIMAEYYENPRFHYAILRLGFLVRMIDNYLN